MLDTVSAARTRTQQVWIMTPLIINTPTQQTPHTGDRARYAASTAPNTRAGACGGRAACWRRPDPPRPCKCTEKLISNHYPDMESSRKKKAKE